MASLLHTETKKLIKPISTTKRDEKSDLLLSDSDDERVHLRRLHLELHEAIITSRISMILVSEREKTYRHRDSVVDLVEVADEPADHVVALDRAHSNEAAVDAGAPGAPEKLFRLVSRLSSVSNSNTLFSSQHYCIFSPAER